MRQPSEGHGTPQKKEKKGWKMPVLGDGLWVGAFVHFFFFFLGGCHVRSEFYTFLFFLSGIYRVFIKKKEPTN